MILETIEKENDIKRFGKCVSCARTSPKVALGDLRIQITKCILFFYKKEF